MKQYDFAKATEFFGDKMAFTTGLHELQLLVEGGWDTWVRSGYGIEVTAKSA